MPRSRPIVLRDADHAAAVRAEITALSLRNSSSGCWDWIGTAQTPGGRGRLKVDRQWLYAYRVAYIAWGGELRDDQEVCHRCDNPRCVAPAHLFAGSHLDNMRDALAKGRYSRSGVVRGERHGNVRHSDEFVGNVVARCRAGESQTKVAQEVGVSQSTVWRWVNAVNRTQAVAA